MELTGNSAKNILKAGLSINHNHTSEISFFINHTLYFIGIFHNFFVFLNIFSFF